ncbi:MAG: hypothetical protein ABIH41_05870 [Nanoarchaeota archaeon]
MFWVLVRVGFAAVVSVPIFLLLVHANLFLASAFAAVCAVFAWSLSETIIRRLARSRRR